MDLKQAVDILKNNKCTMVSINFSGSGDSGEIDYPVFHFQFPGEEVKYVRVPDLKKMLLMDYEDVYRTIVEFADQKIHGTGIDWWNNDGGYGTMEIYVNGGDYRIDTWENIVTQELHVDEGTL